MIAIMVTLAIFGAFCWALGFMEGMMQQKERASGKRSAKPTNGIFTKRISANGIFRNRDRNLHVYPVDENWRDR